MVDRTLAEGAFPHIVLEVIETSPLLDKLAVYDGFGVPEVWIFEGGAFSLYQRRKRGGYDKVAKSTLLPRLDFDLLVRLATMKSQQAALEELARALARPKKRKVTKRR
jgi:Uma2 family endonuclease